VTGRAEGRKGEFVLQPYPLSHQFASVTAAPVHPSPPSPRHDDDEPSSSSMTQTHPLVVIERGA
jgi:hypothetical protein